MKRMAVYCGSATPADPRYIELARHVGETLARQGIGVVYGGGRLGLMGAIAASAMLAGGEVIGVIPEALVGGNGRGGEVANYDCDLTIVGTMDELWEAVSWAQLGYHDKPVGVLNAFGFYDGLLAFNRHMAEVGFVRPAHQGIILAETELEPLLERMRTYQPITPIVRMNPDTL